MFFLFIKSYKKNIFDFDHFSGKGCNNNFSYNNKYINATQSVQSEMFTRLVIS